MAPSSGSPVSNLTFIRHCDPLWPCDLTCSQVSGGWDGDIFGDRYRADRTHTDGLARCLARVACSAVGGPDSRAAGPGPGPRVARSGTEASLPETRDAGEWPPPSTCEAGTFPRQLLQRPLETRYYLRSRFSVSPSDRGDGCPASKIHHGLFTHRYVAVVGGDPS